MQTVHLALSTTAKIVNKSINKSGGRITFKWLLHVRKGAIDAKTDTQFDALVLDESSGVNTYPFLEVNEENSVSSYDTVIRKVGTDQMFYLMSRGYSKYDAISLICSGFVEPFLKRISVEYAVDLSRLLQHEMEEGISGHVQAN
jgi:Fe-S cluster assembly protein SufB